MWYRTGIALAVVTILPSCATQGINSFSYNTNEVKSVTNEIIVQKPQPQVWDALVKELSKSFYVINNIDKESRFINVSFSAESPVDYVDCGTTRRTYTQGDNTEVYNYEVAGASSYKIAGRQQPHPSWISYGLIRRETSLEGRSNMYIAPSDKDESETVVTVNTRYIWDVKVKGEEYAEHVAGNVVSHGSIPGSTTKITFNTNKPGYYNKGQEGQITCFSTGRFEQDILDMVAGIDK
jgi:hypothetical protein